MNTTDNTSNIWKWAVIAGLGFYGYSRYKKFIQFIDNLKINLNPLKLSDDKATVLIENLTNENIPSVYGIKSINIINESDVLASSSQPEANSLITTNAESPVIFNLSKPTTSTDLQNGKVAIEFSWFGLKEKRLYDVLPITESVLKTESKNQSNNKCGCGCGC